MRNTPEKADAELAEREAALLAESGVIGATAPENDVMPVDLSRLMEHPQVKAAISAAVAESVAAVVAQLGQHRAVAGSDPSATDHAFAESLVIKMDELINQRPGGRNKAVAPMIVAQRRVAREAMTDALLRCRAQKILPQYEARAKCYLSEEMVYPTFVGPDKQQYATRFCWPGVPNEAMVPVNDAAREIHKHFLDSIGHVPLPPASDPLVEGFQVLNGPATVAAAGQGQGDGELRLINRQPVHVLGTVAPPLRATS